MNIKMSQRSAPDFQSQFLTNILGANVTPGIVTFAGGNPNSASFPVEELRRAADAVMKENGVMALQYGSTQGYLPLRKYIAEQYRNEGIEIDPSEIIITNGSQQAIDLFSYIMIDDGDCILVEDPTYLAALQIFHRYNSKIVPIELGADGVNIEQLRAAIETQNPKFMYLVPTFQNPTGLSSSSDVRAKLAEVMKGSDMILLEDNPYGRLYFYDKPPKGFGYYLGEQCVMIGTFSKMISPGLRIGWIVCRQKEMIERMLTCKSTTDLHTNIFAQMVLFRYLQDNSLEEHLERNRILYRHKAELMISCIEKYFPDGCICTRPRGGIFIWVTLPMGLKGVDVQKKALERGVAVCAGDPFFSNRRDVPNLRLNFSNYSDETIENSMAIVGAVIAELLEKK